MKVLSWAGFLPPFFLSTVVLAETAPGPGVSGHNQILEEVTVTATRREQSTQDVAIAISTLDIENLLEQTPDTVAEALRGQPGVYFQQTTPGQGIPIIRGLKGSQILHMVDGMRLNNAFFRNAPNQYLGLVDSYSTERIEVVRGAAGSLYGADAMGGVVNIITAEPQFEGEDWQTRSRLYGSYQGAVDGYVLRAQTSAGKSGVGFQGGITYQDFGDRRIADGEKVTPSAYEVRAADFKVLVDIGSNSDLMLSINSMEQPSTPRTDELVPGYGQDLPSSSQYQFEPNRRDFLHARYRYDSNSSWFEQVEINLARQVIDDDRITQDTGSTLVNTEQNSSTLDGLTVQFNRLINASVPLHLVWGLEWYQDEVDSNRERTDLESGETFIVRSRFPDGSGMDSLAGYAALSIEATERWNVDVGLRYSAFDITLPATLTSPAVDLSPSDLTGDLRLVYALSPTTNLVANIGRGFRPPNIFDLGTLGPRPGNRFNVANADLEPETVWSYDLGIKWVGDQWQGELFAYHLDYTDKITSVETGETTPDGRIVVQSENLNAVSITGIEAGLSWFASDRLAAYMSLNYTYGTEKPEGENAIPADRIPPLSGRIGLNWNWSDSLSIEPYLLYSADQDRLSPRDVNDSRINPNGTPDWLSLNIQFRWQVSPVVSLGLQLRNLADEAYREHGSGIDAAGRNVGLWGQMNF